MIRPFRLFGIALSLVSAVAWCGCHKTESTSSAEPAPPVAKIDLELTSPDEVLEKMVAAYKNAKSYEDFGTVHLHAETSQRTIDDSADFSVAFVRPNKLRMQIYQGTAICDGKQWFAFIKSLPGVAVVRKAPATVTTSSLRADGSLYEALNAGFAGAAPQPLLLFEDEAMKALLDGVQEKTLDEPVHLGPNECYQVRLRTVNGDAVYWIDKKTFVLRQMELPTDEFRRDLEKEGAVKKLSVVANFERAKINEEVEPTAFQFAVPAGAEVSTVFATPGPYSVMGKKLADVKYTDMEGKPVSSATITGKAAVLEFWSVNSPPCRLTLSNLEQIYQKYKGNDKIVFYAVNIDPPEVTNKMIEDAAKEIKFTMPILRDPDMQVAKSFKLLGPPTTLFVDAKGTLQDCIMGGGLWPAATETQKIESLLAGKDLATETLSQFHRSVKDYEKRVDDAFQGKEFKLPQAEIAAKSSPTTYHLKPLWKCTDIQQAGNILVVPQSSGSPRVFVVDGYKGISELGIDGKVLASQKSDIENEEMITDLRTAAGRDGKRYYVGFGLAHQRFHLFDENWKLLLHFPENALTNRHPGMADVELGDLDGDGVIKAYVGYLGAVGVQGVALDGQRAWSNRSIMNVWGIVIGDADAQGKRNALCVNDSNAIAVLDSKGNFQTNIPMPSQILLQRLRGANLQGAGKQSLCGLSLSPEGQMTAVGLGRQGEILWSYDLPKGVHQKPIEPIVPGRLKHTGPGQWLLPGSDGSIHIVSADGKPLDKFNYGALLTGLATAEWEGKEVLLIASEGGVEAFQVE